MSFILFGRMANNVNLLASQKFSGPTAQLVILDKIVSATLLIQNIGSLHVQDYKK